ncbi:hypothetical protein SODALDRAFT_329864 [Sodiomyces alkalinus F11]|uniref:U3 snoRNA associated n=1 Tax=Sodiomyces alkalinus (strain CBS 110278 / VKM F-3762 / F11) TaxID=1314773 RepID=A0A3N2Q096_SODAK|nr:hypothetical protein SODALDRAFT_329864 [Sodiomyces alkalinus F11]ROT40191.1 hypothetical protein SODALDRAFT_329864 [Sodiomyces alkalinus F11]
MVSTRQMRKRKTEEDGDAEEPSARTSSASISPPKRQRKLPVRAKDSERPNSSEASSIVIEIRAKSKEDDALDEASNGEADVSTGAERPKLDLEAKEASGDGEPQQADVSGNETSEANVEVELEGDFSSSHSEAKRLVATPSRVSEAGPTKSSGPARSRSPDDGESDSDSDDAPEVVSTSKAAAQVLRSAKAANRAITEQARAQKRKRQERSAFLQEQAKSRKAQQPQTPGVKSDVGDDPEGDITPRTQLTLESDAAASRRKRLATQTTVPSVLPAEYLDSDSDDSDAEMDPEHTAKPRPRKARKVVTAQRSLVREAKSTLPRDEMVGSTLYRPAPKKQDERLAPKGSKQSANAKRALMIRGRSAVKTKKGFFIK